MQTSTLPDLLRREGIPDYQPIFHFRKEEGRGVIEFELPTLQKTEPEMSADEAFRRLEALQFSLGRPTNSVKIIRKMRRDRYPRRLKTRSQQSRKK